MSDTVAAIQTLRCMHLFFVDAHCRGMPLVVMVSTNYTLSKWTRLLELLEQRFRLALEGDPGEAKP